MPYSDEIKNRVFTLRTKGYSFTEISNLLKLPRGTIYSWTHSIVLNQEAQARITKLRQSGIEKTKQWFLDKRNTNQQKINTESNKILAQIKLKTPHLQLLTALLFWAEGSKLLTNVAFMNSDPIMIEVFLKLFRSSFSLTESKFRVLLHLHEYHDEAKMITFWSTITRIPISQFTKTYIKPHTKKRQHPNYPGCCKIKYYDAHIARLLTGIYNTFAQELRGVVQR